MSPDGPNPRGPIPQGPIPQGTIPQGPTPQGPIPQGPIPQGWEAVIGLEVHAQLATRTKLFCACSTAFGGAPNAHTCPVCFGYPGVLPVLNHDAVELALRAALALGCRVPDASVFARKNYFYPDLPKGYQISQYAEPLAVAGALAVTTGGRTRTIGITRVHMEEDAGKLVHEAGAPVSLVDLNRAGTPLVEIVSEPEVTSAEEAAAYVRTLRNLLCWVGVNDGQMAEGSLRCDANVSVRRLGERRLGTRAEIKNMNSFRNIERAVAHEIERQVALLEDGGTVVQETRLWDEAGGRTRSMRSKEEAHDYRYFPEPDLPVLRMPPERVERARAALPELPAARRERFVRELGLPEAQAAQLTERRELSEYLLETVSAGAPARPAANWITTALLAALEGGAEDPYSLGFPPASMAELVALVEADEISGNAAKTVLATAIETGEPPRAVVARLDLAQVSDAGALEVLVAEVLAAHPDEAERFRSGETKLLGFFVGRVMKRSGGKANPKRVGDLVRERLATA